MKYIVVRVAISDAEFCSALPPGGGLLMISVRLDPKDVYMVLGMVGLRHGLVTQAEIGQVLNVAMSSESDAELTVCASSRYSFAVDGVIVSADQALGMMGTKLEVKLPLVRIPSELTNRWQALAASLGWTVHSFDFAVMD